MNGVELAENWKRACRADELTRRFPEPPESSELVNNVLKRVMGSNQPPDVVLAGNASGFASADYEASGEARYLQLCALVIEASKVEGSDPHEALKVMTVVGQATVQLLVSAWRVEAEVDSLTGLGNRRNMERMVSSFEEQKAAFAYASIDADGLKAVNDQSGHAAGDAMLKQLGNGLGQAAGSNGGTAFRYGGDEFGIVLSGESAAARLEEVLSRARSSLSVRAVEFSAGVASWPTTDSDVSSVIDAADRAMYEQKRGRKAAALAMEDDDPPKA